MSYASLITRQGIEANLLVVLKPRILVSGLALFSGSVYRVSFTRGHVARVFGDSVELTAASSSSLSPGQFYYDPQTQYLYTYGNSWTYVTVVYEVYLSTKDLPFFRIPTDSTQTQVFFSGVIAQLPNFKASMGESAFGFIPAQTTQIMLLDPNFELAEHLHDASFANVDVDVYQLLGPALASNAKKVYVGAVTGIQVQDTQVTISIIDKIDAFNQSFSGSVYMNLGSYTCDPAYVGRPIPIIYGRKEGVRLVNMGYKAENPTTSDNRVWGVCQDDATTEYQRTVTTSGFANTTTLTNYTSPQQGPPPGVSQFVFFTGAYTNLAGVVTTPDSSAIGVGSNPSFLVHEAIPAPRSSGDKLAWHRTANVRIIQDGKVYKCVPKRDFDLAYDPSVPMTYITFKNNFEANVGMPKPLTSADVVTAMVFGRSTLPTIGGASFGSLSVKDTGFSAFDGYSSIDNVVVAIYDIMRTFMRIPEADINTASFQALQSSVTGTLSLRVPEATEADYPTYAEVISGLLMAGLLRLYLDSNLQWTLAQITPVSSPTKTVTDDDTLQGSVRYEYSYQDVVTNLVVEYDQREVPEAPDDQGPAVKKSYSTNAKARALHGVSRQRTFAVPLRKLGNLENRLKFLFGDRSCRVSMTVSREQSDVTLGDSAQVSFKRLPGQKYDGVTEFTRNLALIETEKSLHSVTLVADDQKGVQDNSGSW